MISMIIAGMEDDFKRRFMENIYKKFYSEMKYKALNIVNNENDAEEIVQEAFIRLIGKVDTLMRIENNKLPAYLIVTVKNVSINFLKHKSYENGFLIYSDEKDTSEWLPDEENLPELLYLRQEEIETLARALPLLPERDLKLLEARYILNIPSEEIAKQFGIAPGSIRTYIMRAKRKAYSLYQKEEKINV